PFPFQGFLDIELEGPFGLDAVDPHEFPAGLGTGGDLEQPARRLQQMQAQLLRRLAHRAVVVVLACGEMPGGRGIPQPRGAFLAQRSALQEHAPEAIEHEHVGGTMAQAAAMDIRTRSLADHFVPLIDDVENLLVAHLRLRGSPLRRDRRWRSLFALCIETRSRSRVMQGCRAARPARTMTSPPAGTIMCAPGAASGSPRGTLPITKPTRRIPHGPCARTACPRLRGNDDGWLVGVACAIPGPQADPLLLSQG